MNFFVMYAESCIENYIAPSDDLKILLKGCLKSEFQYLDRAPITANVAEDGGEIFADFLIYGEAVPLVSARFRQVLDRAGVDNIFYKPITLKCAALGQSESYFLALPPRIDCLKISASIVEVEENEFASDDELLKEVTKIVIDYNKVGNYKIFKLPAEFKNQEIIVTEELKKVLEVAGLENVYFAPLEEM